MLIITTVTAAAASLWAARVAAARSAAFGHGAMAATQVPALPYVHVRKADDRARPRGRRL